MIEDLLVGVILVCVAAIAYMAFDVIRESRQEKALEAGRQKDRARRRLEQQEHNALGQPIPWVDMDDGLDISKLQVRDESLDGA